MKKNDTWLKILITLAAAIATLSWVGLPAAAQITPKQPTASGSVTTPMQMRGVTNEQQKAAALELAARRTLSWANSNGSPNNSGYQNSNNPVGSSNTANRNLDNPGGPRPGIRRVHYRNKNCPERSKIATKTE